MADAPTSRLGLVVPGPIDLDAVLAEARSRGGIDRASPLASDPAAAREVHWGGRLQRAVVRVVEDEGTTVLRAEAIVASEGWRNGIAHQARLLVALVDALGAAGVVVGPVRDLSARRERDPAWLGAALADALTVPHVVGIDVVPGPDSWLAVHGAARFGVPDLELYGVPADRIDRARALLLHVQATLLDGGLGAPLDDGAGSALRLVPVLEAWTRLPIDWPGVGRGDRVRGPGLDGPRATLSRLRRRPFGRLPLDLAGVIDGL